MIIITGGAGFIGSSLVWALNQKAYEDIVIVDALRDGTKWKNLVKRKFTQILHKDELFTWLQDTKNASAVEAILHMGACSATTEMNMDYLLKNNVQYSMRLFEFCAQAKIPFVYASSAATYGLGEIGYKDESQVAQQLRPINPYGYSKQLFDLWALKQKQTPLCWYGLKFFNVFGPNEYHKEGMRSLVAKAYPQVLKQGQIKLFKSYLENYAHGEQMRDFIYIKDVVKVCLHFLEKKPKQSGLFNVGTGKSRSFVDLGKAVFSAVDKNQKADFEWIEMPHELRGQYQYFTEADLTRLRKVGDYHEPFMSLEDSITDYVSDYLVKEDSYL